MKSFYLCFCFIWYCIVLSASHNKVDSDTTIQKFRYQLGITPSAIINVFHGVQLSHKFQLTSRIRFDLETAYLFDRLGIFDKAFSGYRIRPSIAFRFYENLHEGFDINLFYNYRKFRYFGEREFIRANGAYKEILQIERNTMLQGPGVMLNYSIYEGKYSFSFGGGLGLGILDNAYNPGFQLNNGWFDQSGETEFLMFFFHFNVGLINL